MSKLDARVAVLLALGALSEFACGAPSAAGDSSRADAGPSPAPTISTTTTDSGSIAADSATAPTTPDATDADAAADTATTNADAAMTDDAAPDASASDATAVTTDAGPAFDAGLVTIPHLPYDANGWTIFPTDYAVSLYVDSVTGNDSNAGTSPTAPIKTLAHAASLIDSRPANQTMAVLFKRGSTWPGEVLAMSNGGDTADHPLLLDGWDYGDSTQPRPALGRISLWKASHVALAGLYVGPGGGNLSGIENAGNAGTDILIEDCVVDGFWQNIILCGSSNTAPFTDFRMRRSQSINAYDGNYATNDESKPQGIYLCALQDAILEENVFDHNAYKNDDLSDATEFGHDIYISNYAQAESFDVQLVGNLVSRGLHSVKGPATGTLENNLFDDDGFGGYIGSQGGSFSDNVLVDNTPKSVHTYHLSAPTTFIVESGGYSISGMSAGSANGVTTVNANLFARGAGAAFSLDSNDDANLVFQNNVMSSWVECISSWDSSASFAYKNNQCQGGSAFTLAFELHYFDAKSSVFSGNSYYGPGGTKASYFTLDGTSLAFPAFETQASETGSSFQQASYTNAQMSVMAYMAQLPGAPASPTLADFVTAVQGQSKFNWQQAYRIPVVNNAMRAGFGMAAVPVPTFY